MAQRRGISDGSHTRLIRLHEQVVALSTRARAAPRYVEQDWAYFVVHSPLGAIEGLLGMPFALDETIRRNAQAMTFTERTTRLARMLHVLWTIAGGSADYDKADWRELEDLIGIGYPDPQLAAVLRGIVV